MTKIFKIVLLFGIFSVSVLAGITSMENNISENIPDNSCISKTFVMPTTATVTNTTIEVNIDHGKRADLGLTLTSPLGTAVDLTTGHGKKGENLYVLFDDAATTSIVDDETTHTSLVTLKPETTLSAFDTENPQGTWTLEICDTKKRNTGTYNYAVLHIDDTPPPPPSSPLVEYRMDECYWLGNSGEIKDSSINISDASSYNSAAISQNDAKINFSAHFTVDGDYIETNDASVGNTNGEITISFWVKLEQQMGTYAAVLLKTTPWDWNDGWGFVNPDAAPSNTFRFFIADWSQSVDTTLTVAEGWTHFVGTYDGNDIQLYKNGSQVGSTSLAGLAVNSVSPLRMAYDTDINTATLKGKLDEIKVWDFSLSPIEILDIYNKELTSKNYDGTVREGVTCNASITGGTWEMIGIPSDLRTATNKDVADVFEEFPAGSYGSTTASDRWIVYKRVYSLTDNSSSYAVVPLTGEALEFGRGYYLGSAANNSWSENGLPGVDYDSSNPNCPTNRCVEIDVTSASLDIDSGDDLLGTGPYRYNLSGFIGHSPVDWADCRFIVDGTAYTPSAAEIAGFASKTIWQYNPGSSGVNPNGYTTCDDVTPGNCSLEPYNSFWVELHGSTKGKTVKLLIPQE